MKRILLLTPWLASLGIASVAVSCSSTRETRVSVEALPPAVKASLDKVAAGGKVTESEMETRAGKTVYSFDVKLADGEHDVTIAEDGTVLENSLD